MRRKAEYRWKVIQRKCPDVTFESFSNYIRLEQEFLTHLVNKTNVTIFNCSHNDPEPKIIWANERRYENPIYTYRPDKVIFVGYTNKPNKDFSLQGTSVSEHFLPENQDPKQNIQDVIIDGNTDEDLMYLAINEDDFYKTRYQWWNNDSFVFLYGGSVKSHINQNEDAIILSGFSTSWATPLALSMARYLEKNGINRVDLKTKIKGKIFDPLANKQFINNL